jgi:soluble lytic murein transglycosylase-like protein
MFKSKTICVLSVIFAVFSIVMISSISAKEEKPENMQENKTATETTTQIKVEVQTIYNVPLSDELQIYTQKVCKEYNVPFDLVIGVMFIESTFNQSARNGNCYGLMQVNTINGHSK